ncbi:39868_t:CDS:2 [Gigaspora margarita]|uniref:39868_t:CDS:1 n=1 Tax=Gigaspora margarita TaxID=4874 RepID=A0ABN7UHD7_GIGMA|nr:39868_t:CDS:2 [Gigaspora margarita]
MAIIGKWESPQYVPSLNPTGDNLYTHRLNANEMVKAYECYQGKTCINI